MAVQSLIESGIVNFRRFGRLLGRNQKAIPGTPIANVQYLIIGGGGGGGTPGASRCGGGGSGGYLAGTTNLPGSFDITVGAGGAVATVGGDSILDSITAFGGGFGASNVGQQGGPGGSGGGGNRVGQAGGQPVAGQGFVGGFGSTSSSASDSGGGGGGGAGGAGIHLAANAFTNEPAPGGVGVSSTITGSTVWYGEGGAGSGFYNRGIYNQNIGGNISGHIEGTVNTGSGGGGGKTSGFAPTGPGGPGGSGVVIIAYPNSLPAITSIDPGLSYDQPSRSGFRVYRFTSGTGSVII